MTYLKRKAPSLCYDRCLMIFSQVWGSYVIMPSRSHPVQLIWAEVERCYSIKNYTAFTLNLLRWVCEEIFATTGLEEWISKYTHMQNRRILCRNEELLRLVHLYRCTTNKRTLFWSVHWWLQCESLPTTWAPPTL